MLTNLDFLNIGEKFPPISEKSRIDMYQNNKALFEGGHVSVYAENLKRIERVIGNFEEVVSYPVVLNFQKLMSLKIADLLVGEPPKFVSESQQTKLDELIKYCDLVNISYMTGIDISRYGDGLMYVRKDKLNKGIIDITQPYLWYPVVSPDNIKEIVYHVLAWTYETGPVENRQKYIKCQIHSKGSYEQRVLMTSGVTIEKQISSEVFATGLDDFAIVQVPNIMTSDRVTGIDDYTDIDSIISDLMVRVGQIDRILDKHASPTMTGPLGALEQDPVSGEWKFKSGTYIPAEKEDMKPEYIIWDGQLEAAFKQIEILMNVLYKISELGAILLGEVEGEIPSGSAFKRMAWLPLAKVNRIRMRFDHALKKAIKLCGQLNNVKLDDVSITWQDGLPSDPYEESQIIANRMPGIASLSVKTALQRYDQMTEGDAEAEVKQILDEAPAPLITGGMPEAIDETPA